ncbi:MAG: IS30 family transposase, partial [Bacteroidales bacterium]|nr:IS30 family transposase [Candidatus Cacconaster equifaecalis]
DFEIDTMIGKNHKGAIMTTNDRCTHIVLIRRLEEKEATPLAEAAVEALSPYKQMLHTITADNGKEFARHKEIAEVEWKLNNRPRKSLGYLTPLEYCKKMYNFTSDSAVALSN